MLQSAIDNNTEFYVTVKREEDSSCTIMGYRVKDSFISEDPVKTDPITMTAEQFSVWVLLLGDLYVVLKYI